MAPRVSMATGVKEWPWSRYEYFRSSAAAATASVAIAWYDGAKVSGQVASQTKGFPSFHRTIVTPSGRLPSSRSSPEDSRRDGILAEHRARDKMSLMAECLRNSLRFFFTSSHV